MPLVCAGHGQAANHQQLQVMLSTSNGPKLHRDAPNAKNTLITATITASRLRPPWPAAVKRNTSCCACSKRSLVRNETVSVWGSNTEHLPQWEVAGLVPSTGTQQGPCTAPHQVPPVHTLMWPRSGPVADSNPGPHPWHRMLRQLGDGDAQRRQAGGGSNGQEPRQVRQRLHLQITKQMQSAL